MKNSPPKLRYEDVAREVTKSNVVAENIPVQKNPIGRPTKYKPEYCEEIIDYVGKQGKSLMSFAIKIDVDEETVTEWSKKNPEFSVALTRAKRMSENYWSEWIANNLDNQKVNAPLTKLYMSNRFNWSEKRDQNISIQVEDVTNKLKEIKEKYGRDY